MRGSQGINRLARTLASRMADQGVRQPDNELGTMKMVSGQLCLVTDRFPVPITSDDYLVCAGSAARVIDGARVLVSWANDGTDPVIIDTV